jgi:uncharacterized membrane protein
MNPKLIKRLFRILVAMFFILAGIAHFLSDWTPFYVGIVPHFLPHPRGLVYFTGAWEIFGGVGLMIPGLRRLSGYSLILLLFLILPANVTMLIQNYHEFGFSLATWLLVLRIPLQFIFMHIVNVLSKYP